MTPLHLEVSIDDQVLRVLRNEDIVATFPVSTAAKGVGFTNGSYRTPVGRFEIADKIGEGEEIGTIFKARVPCGIWKTGDPGEDDLILTRILRLRGLDEENANTYDRYIYIHGTNQEDLIGTPDSHGCIRLRNEDMIKLFDLVESGTELHIQTPTRSRGKLLFLDCDSTLSTIEGIDELARARGPEVFQQVVALTDAAMNGEFPIGEVFPRRMELIRPDRALADQVAQQYIATVEPGAQKAIEDARAQGWTPVILSGGFAPLIEPLARELGIQHVEAVPLSFHADGAYETFDALYPTTRNGGKPEVIREWIAAMHPEQTMMIGDGISDLETKGIVDRFIAYTGVVAREKVIANADASISRWSELNEQLRGCL